MFFFRRCIQEIFYFLSKVEIISFFFSTVLFSSASEVDRRQTESVVIGRQSNVETSVAAPNKKGCHRLVRYSRISTVQKESTGENPYVLVRSFRSCSHGEVKYSWRL